MIITEVKARTVDGWSELTGLVISERKRERRQWIRWQVPDEYAGMLIERGDPFLAALLPLCMKTGERLRIEASVSSALLQSVEAIQAIFHEWLPGSSLVPVDVPSRAVGPAGAAVGCFFSGGVDSFYSLLKNDQLPADNPGRISHLLFVGGFDLPVTENPLVRKVRTSLEQVSVSSGRRLLEVKTNLRSFSDPLLSWDLYHGAALASVGLACGSLLRKILIPSSFAYEQLHPWGSHPRLDPLWSTERTEFVHDGCEALRSEKIIDWICRSELAMENLRVCWKNYHGHYNCSVCEKCVRTMISLHIGTGNVSFPTFDRPLTAKGIRQLNLKNETQFAFARENEALMLDHDCDKAIANALSDAIHRSKKGMTK